MFERSCHSEHDSSPLSPPMMTIVIESDSDSDGDFEFVECLEGPDDPDMQALTSRMSETTLVESVSSETTVNPTTGNRVAEHIRSQGYSREGRDRTLYTVQSRFISDWSLAAHIGQTNGHTVEAIKKRKKRQTPAVAYTVFVGREPGVYHTWDSCWAEVEGMLFSVQCGFETVTHTEATFVYALERGWVHYSDQPVQPSLQPGSIPVFSELSSRESDYNTPLSLGRTSKRWHNIYKGHRPGIYRTHLKASIQTLGITDAMTESFETLQLAWEKFRLALRNSTVEVLV